MKTLVLCVDRDNDLGEKAHVRSPVIGRAKNIEAATQLALVDPEDSDVNAVFAGVKVFDELKAAGMDVEIASICGGKEVNEITDTVMANQLELTLQFTGASGVVLVTDGAEDENILPLIQSRAKINSIRRVIVRQDSNIEGAYYFITKALEDEKMKRIVLPLAMVLVILGLSYGFNVANQGWSAVITLLGVYLSVKSLHWEKNLISIYRDMQGSVKGFKVSLIAAIVASLIIIAGVVGSYDSLVDEIDMNDEARSQPDSTVDKLSVADQVLIFTEDVIWWLIFAGICLAFGNVFDELLTERKVAIENLNVVFYLIALGMILTASIYSIQRAIGPGNPDLIDIFLPLVIGITVLFVGRYAKALISENLPPSGEPEARGWRK